MKKGAGTWWIPSCSLHLVMINPQRALRSVSQMRKLGIRKFKCLACGHKRAWVVRSGCFTRPDTASYLQPIRSSSGQKLSERCSVRKVLGKTDLLGSPLVLQTNQGIFCLTCFFPPPRLKQNNRKSLNGDKWGTIKVSAALRIQALQLQWVNHCGPWASWQSFASKPVG